MIEMVVRAVTCHPHTGRVAAILMPRHADAAPALAVTITRAEACWLSHELRDQPTVRSQAFDLLARCLAFRESRVRALRLVPGVSGMATGRLELAWPDGQAETTIEPGQALGLALALGLPILAAEVLFRETGSGAAPLDGATADGAAPRAVADSLAVPDSATPTSTSQSPATPVPAAFTRAFD